MFTTLISVDELHQLQRDEVVIFDCRFSLMQPEKGAQDFSKNRIPGAHYANLDTDLAGVRDEASGRHPLPDKNSFCAWLKKSGVRQDVQTVVYDDAGGAIAARLWWMLRWAGFSNAALLDGGWQEWTRKDYPLDETSVTVQGSIAANQVIPNVDDWLTTSQLQQDLSANTIKIIDARDAKRFAGEKEPIDPVAGHIPGALNRPFQSNLNGQGLFKTPEQLREEFLPFAANATESRGIVHSCGSGVTACHNLLAMEHAGLAGSRLYVGSWSEWIADSSRPVAVGMN